jgi:hypothetical protein
MFQQKVMVMTRNNRPEFASTILVAALDSLVRILLVIQNHGLLHATVQLDANSSEHRRSMHAI